VVSIEKKNLCYKLLPALVTSVDVVFLLEGIIVDNLLQHRLFLVLGACGGGVIVGALVETLVVRCCFVASFA
jgi:hypothetical protein